MGKARMLSAGALAVVGLVAATTGVGEAATRPPTTLSFLGAYDSGAGETGSEIVAYDGATQRMFVTNGATNAIDVVDISNPASPALLSSIDLAAYGSGVQSVAVKGGLGVAAVAGTPVTAPGQAVFFDTTSLAVVKAVGVGALPDNVTFTSDGRWALTANEGEPRCIDAAGNPVTDPVQATNPVGSVSVIDLRKGIASASVRHAGFEHLNRSMKGLQARGVRVGTWPGATVAQDLEPEYIAIDPDGKRAYVTLQENNAIATVELATARVTSVKGLGLVDHSQVPLDASDEDNAYRQVAWPVSGMYMPDTIAAWQAKGRTYLITANEGDGREYFAGADNVEENPDGSENPLCFLDEARVKDMTLDPAVFGDVEALQEDENLGRLKVTKFLSSTSSGGVVPTDDTDPSDVPGLVYSCLASYGTRSFAIWGAGGNLVHNSGSLLEQKVDELDPEGWLDRTPPWATDIYDSRSDDKGPEPEAVAVAQVGNRTLAFVGIERAGGIMVFDVTNPAKPAFQDWVRTEGQVSPEGLAVVPAAASPTGTALLLAAFEISGTTAIYQLA